MSLPPLIASGIGFGFILQSAVYPFLKTIPCQLLGFDRLRFVLCRRLCSNNIWSILDICRWYHHLLRHGWNNWIELHWTITLRVFSKWTQFILPGPIFVNISRHHGLILFLHMLLLRNLTSALSYVLPTWNMNLTRLRKKVARRQLILTLATCFPALCLWVFLL